MKPFFEVCDVSRVHDLASELTPVTVGVGWSEAQEYSSVAALPAPDQEKVMVTVAGVEHQAWCSPDGLIHYQAGSGAVEQIPTPACSGPPGLAVDSDGLVHLVWYAQAIEDATETPGDLRTIKEYIEKDASFK